jgi:hypothetical protein
VITDVEPLPNIGGMRQVTMKQQLAEAADDTWQ